MIIDAYRAFTKHPGLNKVIGNDYVCLEFNCPLDIEQFQILSHYHLITFVLSGKKDWIAPDQTLQINAGDAIFVRKGVYSTKQYFELDYCVLLFLINDQFIRDFIDENQIQGNGADPFQSIYKIKTDRSFLSLADSLFNYLSKPESVPQKLVELKFKELLYTILLTPGNQAIKELFISIHHSFKSDLESVMLQNFRFDLKLEDFAKLCGRSLSGFQRDFKKHFNTTPSRWLVQKRLEFAKTLLSTSNYNVNEICYESGFKNPTHFIRAFKKAFGKSPGKFKTT